MSDRAQTLIREALMLSHDERADLTAELLASLDDADVEDTATVQTAWAREIERRARRVLAGECRRGVGRRARAHDPTSEEPVKHRFRTEAEAADELD